jgi:endonuclease G
MLNKDRRLAFVAAVNYDASAKVHHPRDKDGDKWFFDPRVSADGDSQAGEEVYVGNPLDRGHLVRRADAAWGASKKEAKLANDDTFHFTNCSPQHEVYNQSTKANKKGLRLWGNIEDHISKQAKAAKRKLCIFNGPIFRQNDRKHRGLQVPREFFKVVVFEKEDGQRRAAAFILSQAGLIKNLPAEAFAGDFDLELYAPFQVPVREIESRTKLNFGKLRDWDPLEDDANESFLEAGTEAVFLEKAEDMVL